jgi:hypothetical protein
MGQTNLNDNAHKETMVDTFYQKRTEFISRSWSELNIIDTVKNVNDTLIILFQNGKGFLRQQIDIKNDTGCIVEAFTNYIDNNKLLIYYEHWMFECQNKNPNDFDGILDTYRRFIYDKRNRKSSELIMNISTGTWRYDYQYDGQGQHGKSTKITRNQFWIESAY